MQIFIAEQKIHLLAEKAIFWEEKKTLILSDLHLGKTSTFRRAGIPVSDQAMLQDLMQLESLIKKYHVKRCVIVGDFLHHPNGHTPATMSQIEEWLNQINCKVDLVLGNHDRGVKLLNWRIHIEEQMLLDFPFAFSHQPRMWDNYFTFSGHIHPQVVIAKRRHRFRLPCFVFRPHQCLLPAFSRFAGGHVITPEATDVIYAIAEDSVLKITPHDTVHY
ncbi:MAG: ligase-associated DNA damage response endonuclease PdeM [Parachlamydiaceae bacterium]